jgi:hypothetical protein
MFKKLLLVAVMLGLAYPVTSHASPTNSNAVWQIWVYVATYRDKTDGHVEVTFETSAGTQITNFPDSGGTNQCPSDPAMIVHKDHPNFERMSKSLLAGGLARKRIKIAYEATSGVCYAKQVLLEM